MSPRTRPPATRDDVRLLWVQGDDAWSDHRPADLARLLCAGDLVVVNDAATLPASLSGHVTMTGDAIEVRLVSPHESDDVWQVVLLGVGDWRTPTEDRPPPPTLMRGDSIELGTDLHATVFAISDVSPRLLELQFDRGGAALLSAIYRNGVPIQYAYLDDDLPLWSVQTTYAGRPWAVEMPSAGRPLSWSVLSSLREAGIGVATLTHHGRRPARVRQPFARRCLTPHDLIRFMIEAVPNIVSRAVSSSKTLEFPKTTAP